MKPRMLIAEIEIPYLGFGTYLIANDAVAAVASICSGYRHIDTAEGYQKCWAIQKGGPVLPKSTNPDRIRRNADIFDFNIDDKDMAAIETLGCGGRSSLGHGRSHESTVKRCRECSLTRRCRVLQPRGEERCR